MALETQIFSFLSLMMGILAGELLTYRTFGKPKPNLILIDVVIFVVILSILFAFVDQSALGIWYYAASFSVGILSIAIVRSVESLAGFTELPAGQQRFAINIVRALAKQGLDKDEIKGVLHRSGFSPKIVDKMSDIIDTEIPPFLPKIIRMEQDISEIKEALKKKKRR